MTKRTKAAYEFFRAKSGYGAKGALDLARAEDWARENDVEFSWEWDQDADLSWCDTCEHFRVCAQGNRRSEGCHDCTNRAHRAGRHEHEVMGCVAKGPDDLGASVWGVTDADQNYRRVIEAELASEVRDNVEGTRDMYARHFAE